MFLALVVIMLTMSPDVLAAPSSLDPGFGIDGVVTIDLGLGPDLDGVNCGQATVLPDGKILAVVQHVVLAPLTLVNYLVRFNADGSLDTTFGSNGHVRIADPYGNDGIPVVWIGIQPGSDRFLARLGGLYGSYVAFTSDGVLDTAFGSAGYLLAESVWCLSPDGTFVAASPGVGTTVGTTDLYVRRFTPNGQLDGTFGTSGLVRMDLAHGSNESPTAALVDSEGSIYVAGTLESTTFLLRLRTDGALDASFGTDGVRVPSSGLPYPTFTGPDGNLYAYSTGLSAGGPARLFQVPTSGSIGRLTPDFKPDPGYQPVITLGSWAMMPDGSIVTSGSVDSGYPTFRDFRVQRFTPLGLPDPTFADGGSATIDFGSADDAAAAAVRPDGRILIFGYAAATQTSSVRAGRTASSTTAIMAQLLGGSRTGLVAKLVKSPSTSLVNLRLRSGRASWKTSASLKCSGTPVGAAKLVLMRSRDGRKWTSIFSKATGKTGSSAATIKFTRRGTYYFRWSFAGTTSYRKATAAVTKVYVK